MGHGLCWPGLGRFSYLWCRNICLGTNPVEDTVDLCTELFCDNMRFPLDMIHLYIVCHISSFLAFPLPTIFIVMVVLKIQEPK